MAIQSANDEIEAHEGQKKKIKDKRDFLAEELASLPVPPGCQVRRAATKELLRLTGAQATIERIERQWKEMMERLRQKEGRQHDQIALDDVLDASFL